MPFAPDPPRPRGDAWNLRLYWAGVGLLVAAFFVTHLLPCVDYPQHLALADVARRLQDARAPEQATHQLNYFTYNGLFHIAVAFLAGAMPIELAGRLVVAGSLVATAAAVVALLRALERPVGYAALFTPILFSFSLGWGFVNYVLATAIAIWALVFVARAARKPSGLALASVAALGLACAFAHVLAMIILCVAAAAVALELAWQVEGSSSRGPPARRAWRAVLRAAIALLPLLVGCAYCVAVYQRQYAWNPDVYRDPTLEGTAPPLWQKAVFFPAFATDLFSDHTDAVLIWATLGVIAWSALGWYLPRRVRRPAGAARPAPMIAPFAVLTLAYFATPMVLIGTHLIFPRLAQWAVLGAILAMPRFAPASDAPARAGIAALGLLAGANALVHCALFDRETRDASATIDELPPGMAATAVVLEPWTESFRNGTLTHLAAYYAARKHGAWAFSFARYLSVPVRFKPGGTPPWPAHGWEFSGEDYDARCKYARAFPLVIARVPEGFPVDAASEPALRGLLFKADAAAPRLLSHHGQYWAFDTTGLPDDGTF